jgi:hypothetical protein
VTGGSGTGERGTGEEVELTRTQIKGASSTEVLRKCVLRSKSEIRKVHHRVVLVAEHVLWLDVPVSDPMTVAPVDSVQDLQISGLDQVVLHMKNAAFNDSGEKVASRAIIQGGIHELLVFVEASNGNDIRMLANKPLKRDLSSLPSRFLSPLAYTLDGEDRARLDFESTIDGAEPTSAYFLDEFDLARLDSLSGHVWKISRREVHDAA